MSTKKSFTFLFALLAIFVFVDGLFTVDQRQQAIVTRFGESIRVLKEPGLYLKIPMLDKVVFFDNRLMSAELQALEVTLGDKTRIVVDAFGICKITDPLKFYQAVYDENGLIDKLNSVVLGSLSSVLGGLGLPSLLSDTRISAMKKIRDKVNKAAEGFGIDVVDVRIKKTDFPSQDVEATCIKMRSDREKEACGVRAEGLEKSKKIKSNADKDNAMAISEADRKVQVLISEGELEANKICVEAYSEDREFAEFFQSLEAYRSSFLENNTTFVLSQKNEFFRAMGGK